MAFLRKISRWAKSGLVASAIGLGLLAASPVSALSPSSSYTYTDTTYRILQDVSGNQFAFAQTGCGFVGSENTIRPAKLNDPSKVSVPGSDYCDTDANGNPISPVPADAYWRHDALNYVVITGSSAAAANKSAEDGLSGGAKFVVFDSNGQNPSISDVQIAATTLAGQAVGSSQPDLNGNCRQDAGVLSWLICPLMNLVSNFISRLVGYVLDLLQTDPLILGNQRGDGLYDAWNQFRTIANILLVPIFLISIYAMLFSSANRYTVTRIIPRLVVAALLMQLSFFIAAIIVDIGNVLGAGIAGIFNSVNHQIEAANNLAPVQDLPGVLRNTAFDRGVGAAVGTGLLFALSWLFLLQALPPLLIIAIIFIAGILLTFIALALRQLAIVVFIVLAPLAMVLAVLPNTEKWAREWFDNLAKLVIVYPLVVLFFSAASTLSLLARATGQHSELNQFLASLLPVVVLLGTPLLFRFAGTLFRNITAAISGMAGRARGGVIGDLRDPGSLAFRARMGKIHRRYAHTMGVAGRPGFAWTGRFTQPVRKQRDYYRLGGESIQDVIGTAFPQKLKRLVWGERPFPGLMQVENYTDSDIAGTNWFKFDAMRIRKTPGEFSAIMSGPVASYASGHFDRGMNTIYGIGSQVKAGTLLPDIADEGLISFQFATKGAQRILGTYELRDLINPAINSPRDLYNLAYGDYTQLPADLQQRNFELKQKFIRIGSGTLTEQQGEGTFRAMADTLLDDRIIQAARDNDSFNERIVALVQKAESLNRDLRRAGLDDAQIAQMAGDEEVTVSGFYGKSGNEMRAMRAFIDAATRVRRELDINPGQTDLETWQDLL